MTTTGTAAAAARPSSNRCCRGGRTSRHSEHRSATKLERQRYWTISDELHRRLFVEDVHGGTLAFTRRVWERLAQYPNASLAEDAAFLSQAMGRGARLERIAGEGHFMYVRHRTNAWQFACGTFLDPRGWQRAVPPPLGAMDRRFYARCRRCDGGTSSAAGQLDRVTHSGPKPRRPVLAIPDAPGAYPRWPGARSWRDPPL